MLGVLVFPRATPALVRAHVPERGARVVAVDAGAEALHALGRVPDLVVGDMDSVRAGTLAALERAGARVERHAREKRDTDAALGLRHLAGCDEVLFVGPGGGRPDHALANLHLLAQASLAARARAVDEDHLTWIATPERAVELRLATGAILSAIPFDAEVSGIRYEGLAYPLEDATMRAGDPYGVSNRAAGPAQRVRVGKGRLLLVSPSQPSSPPPGFSA